MRSLHVLWLVTLAIGAAACTDKAVVGSTNAIKKQPACTQECASGMQCEPISGNCVACLTHADCADAGMQCDPKMFDCVQCLKRADCDGNLACVAGACVTCTKDDDCGDGAQCDDGQCKADDQSDDNVGEHGNDSGGSSGSSGSSGKD